MGNANLDTYSFASLHQKSPVVVCREVPGIGDAIMLLPTLERLREHGHSVGILSKYPDLFSEFTDFKVYRSRGEIPSRAQTLDYEGPAAAYESKASKIQKGRVQIYLEHLGFEYRSDVPKLAVSYQQRAAQSKRIGLCLVARTYNDTKFDRARNYPYPVQLAEKARKLGDVTWFHTEPLGVPGVQDFKGNLVELVYEILSQNIVVSIDSAGCHIAGALGVPQLCLFGPTDPLLRVAGYPNAHWIENFKKCPFAHCWYNPCAEVYCLSTVSPREILRKVRRLLNET